MSAKGKIVHYSERCDLDDPTGNMDDAFKQRLYDLMKPGFDARFDKFRKHYEPEELPRTVESPSQSQQNNTSIPCCPLDPSHGPMKLAKNQKYWNCTRAQMVEAEPGKWINTGCRGNKKVGQ